MAHEHPDVLKAFAIRYRESQAGRTGVSAEDFTLDYRKLLKEARADDAEARILAEEHLRRAASQSRGNLVLETHPRDDKLILLVRLKRNGGEEWLFQQLGEPTPTEERQQLTALFDSFRDENVPEIWQEAWPDWCFDMSLKAKKGDAIAPFFRNDLAANRELMHVLVRVLNWEGSSMIRFASCMICGDSKRLEILRPRIETALREITYEQIQSIEDLGLSEKPRQALIHGALHLENSFGVLDLGLLYGPVSLSETDIRAATTIHTAADRILTVENETIFLELAKLNRDTLLIQTSYPNRAVLALLARLPTEMLAFHFGDTDPSGFDILRDLRERSQRAIQPLHMHFRHRAGSPTLTPPEHQTLARLLSHPLMIDCQETLLAMQKAGTKGEYEQESLGKPTLNGWPFYALQS